MSERMRRIFFRGVKKGGVQGHQRVTKPFFELQSPDFAWKFVWTVQKNDEIFFQEHQKGEWFRGV